MEMNNRMFSVFALLLLLFVVQSAAICEMGESGIQACLPAVTGNALTYPTAECCLAVAKSDIQCFCGYKESFLVTLMGIDINQALQIPSKCRIPFHGCPE